LAASHLLAPATGGEDDPLLAQATHVTLDGDDTAGEAEGNVLVGEDTALVDGLVGDARDLVFAQCSQARLFVDREIFLGTVDGESDGNFLAEDNGLAGGFILIDGQVLHLTGRECQLGMAKEVIADLLEVGFSQDPGEIEVPGDAGDDRLPDSLRLQATRQALIQ